MANYIYACSTGISSTWQEFQHPLTFVTSVKNQTLEVVEEIEGLIRGRDKMTGELYTKLFSVIFRIGGLILLGSALYRFSASVFTVSPLADKISYLFRGTVYGLLGMHLIYEGKHSSIQFDKGKFEDVWESSLISGSFQTDYESFSESTRSNLAFRSTHVGYWKRIRVAWGEYLYRTEGGVIRTSTDTDTQELKREESHYVALTYCNRNLENKSGLTQFLIEGNLTSLPNTWSTEVSERVTTELKKRGHTTFDTIPVVKIPRELLAPHPLRARLVF